MEIDYSEIDSLKEEIENWKNGLEGTNLESSDKYNQLEEAVHNLESGSDELSNIFFSFVEEETVEELKDSLQEVVDALENAISSLESVEFPRMY